MIRNDFVSNSSSSSFMIAVEKNYIKTFVDLVCKKLENKKSEYHIKDIIESNKSILNFVFNNIRMLYFGGLLVNDTTRKYSKDDKNTSQYYYFKKMLGKRKSLKRDIEDISINKGIITVTYHEYLWNLTLPKTNYSYEMLNLYREDKNKLKFTKEFQNLIDYTKTPAYCNRYNVNMLEFSTAIIDKNTLLNTKYLISCGYKINTNGWDINKFLDMLSDEKSVIFKIEVCYEGEGSGYDCLYMENEDFFDNLMYSTPGIVLDKNRYGLKEKNK